MTGQTPPPFDEGRQLTTDEIFRQLFATPQPPTSITSMRRTALEFLMPLIDAGIDHSGIEAAAKHPDNEGTLQGQLSYRLKLTDGVYSALSALGVSQEEAEWVISNLALEGFNFRQQPEEIADRLPTWNTVTTANYFYGPEKAGRILTAMLREQEGLNKVTRSDVQAILKRAGEMTEEEHESYVHGPDGDCPLCKMIDEKLNLLVPDGDGDGK